MKDGLCPDMPWFVNDWLASSKRMSMQDFEQNGYFLLLNHAWNDPDCCLPDDDIALARLSELGKKWLKSAGRLRACFEPHPKRPGFIFNRRQFAEREKQQRRIEASKRSANAGANGRWKNHRKATAMRPHSDSTPAAIPDGMRKNASSPVSRLPSLFEDIETSSLVSPSAIAHEILAYWNTKGQLQKARNINGKRLGSARARLKESFFVQHWKEAIDKVSVSSFCTGKVPTKDHPNGWIANLDWFLRPGKVEQIIEGQHDDRNPQPGAEIEHTQPFRTNKPKP